MTRARYTAALLVSLLIAGPISSMFLVQAERARSRGDRALAIYWLAGFALCQIGIYAALFHMGAPAWRMIWWIRPHG